MMTIVMNGAQVDTSNDSYTGSGTVYVASYNVDGTASGATPHTYNTLLSVPYQIISKNGVVAELASAHYNMTYSSPDPPDYGNTALVDAMKAIDTTGAPMDVILPYFDGSTWKLMDRMAGNPTYAATNAQIQAKWEGFGGTWNAAWNL